MRGLVIVIVTLLSAALVWLLNPDWDIPSIAAYMVVAILVAFVGWMDDLYALSARLRFNVHLVSAVVIMFCVGVFHSITLPDYGGLSLGWIGYPLTFLWIVGLINAYNFMDGIDGNAGGIGAVASVMWALTAWKMGEHLLGVISLLVAFSCLGFLWHNWQPARIFMGDVGSTFLGFTFAALPLLAMQRYGDGRLPVVGALIVAPWIWDALYTFLGRLVRREPVFEPHRTYLYQRLASLGHPHWVCAGFYMAMTFATGLCGLIYLSSIEVWGWSMLAVTAVLLFCQVAVVIMAER